MKNTLLVTLSAIGLIGVSVVAYGEVITDTWAWYSEDGQISRPVLGQIPQSDCLETICEYGCVEKNNLVGYCCPDNGQCRVESGDDVDLCCADDEFCNSGVCTKKACIFGDTTYDNNTAVGECGKCVNGKVVQDTIKTLPDCKSSCNTTTWFWNNAVDDAKVDDCHICKNGTKTNVVDGTLVGECHVCRNGAKVNADNGTKVDDCHMCKDGAKVNAPDGTKADDCHVCRNGIKVNAQNGTAVAECGKCQDGSVVQDTNQTAPICKTTCDTGTWLWNNVADNTKLDDCHICTNGQNVNAPDGTPVDDCNICTNGQKVWDEVKCPNGCPPGVDVKYDLIHHSFGLGSGPYVGWAERKKNGCCPADKPVYYDITSECIKPCIVDGVLYNDSGPLFVEWGEKAWTLDPCRVCIDNKIINRPDYQYRMYEKCVNGQLIRLF